MSKHPKASIREIRESAAVLGYKPAMNGLVFAEMLSEEYVEMRLTPKGRRAGRRGGAQTSVTCGGLRPHRQIRASDARPQLAQ